MVNPSHTESQKRAKGRTHLKKADRRLRHWSVLTAGKSKNTFDRFHAMLGRDARSRNGLRWSDARAGLFTHTGQECRWQLLMRFTETCYILISSSHCQNHLTEEASRQYFPGFDADVPRQRVPVSKKAHKRAHKKPSDLRVSNVAPPWGVGDSRGNRWQRGPGSC